MNPDEYVDRLLERRERGEKQLPVITDEVAASLAAAEVLTQLREITAIFDPFLPHKKSVREPVLVSPSPTGLSRSIRAPSRSKIALTKEPSS